MERRLAVLPARVDVSAEAEQCSNALGVAALRRVADRAQAKPTTRMINLLLRELGAEVPQTRIVAEAARHQQHAHVIMVTVVRIGPELFDAVPQHG